MTDQEKVVGVPSSTGVMRFSFAIPLEMVLHSPLENENWNPYNIPLKDRSELMAEANAQGGINSSDPRTYTGYNPSAFFHLTPASFFGGATESTDPADTNSPITIDFGDGTTKNVVNSGIYIFLPKITVDSGTGETVDIRMRYPVYPQFFEGSHAEAGISILKERMDANGLT